MKCVASMLIVVALGIAPQAAGAQEVTASDQLEQRQTIAGEAVDEGTFMPVSTAATHAERKATFKLLSGYDSAGKSGLFRGEADARLTGPFGFRVGASYDGIGDAKARPFVGGYFDVLKQSQHGINLSLQGRFESASFNVVPGVAAGFALSRSFDGALLLFNAEYGQGLQSDERNAAGGLAFLQRITPHLRLGLDSRFQIDLERNPNEPPGELDWRTVAGPLLIANLGPVAATLGGGVSALQYRLQSTTEVGATTYAGVGAAF